MKIILATLALLAFPLAANAGAMSFILGYAVGSGSNSNSFGEALRTSGLSAIPLRCFAALDQSDDAYKKCRRPSLRQELAAASGIRFDGSPLCYWDTDGMKAVLSYPESDCDVEANLNLEITVLHALVKGQEEKSGK